MLRIAAAGWGAAAIGQVPARAQSRQRLLLMTGASGGAFNEYGPALAMIAARHAGIELDIQVSGGSNENIRALGRGEADIGLVNLGPAFEAWHGKGTFSDGTDYRSLRALFAMYETPFSLVALKASGVTNLMDLSGKTVGVGPAGGPGQAFFKGLADAVGLQVKLATGSPIDLARRVLAGDIDAFWFGAGIPVSAFVEVLDKGDAIVFGLDPAQIDAFRRIFAYATPNRIAAGSYKGQTRPIETVAIWNFVLASETLSDEAAYGLTKAALEHSAEMAAILPAASATTLGNVAADTFLTLHPGATRYYRERGVALAAAILPP